MIWRFCGRVSKFWKSGVAQFVVFRFFASLVGLPRFTGGRRGSFFLPLQIVRNAIGSGRMSRRTMRMT